MKVRHYWYVTAGVALVAPTVIAVLPIAAAPPDAHVPEIQLTAGDDTLDATQDVAIYILRHGERAAPYNHLQIPSPPHPGPPLSDLGEQQAQDVGQHLYNLFGGDPHEVAGIFSGQGIRDQATAVPFADLENMDINTLPGINEIDFGIYGLKPLTSFGGILSQMVVALWSAGFELTPMPGSGQDPNGVIFDEKFTGAVNHMYNYALDPDHMVVSPGTDEISAVGFNNEGSVASWVELNTKNPDFPFFLVRGIQSLVDPDAHGILPPTGIIKIDGNPTDGWNLVSWDGHAIPQDPGLVTSLLVDFRAPLIASQQAVWHIWDAILCGGSDFTCLDPDAVQGAVQASLQNLGESLIQLPGAVFNDFAHAVTNPGSAFADITDALEYLANTSGSTAGETAAALGDAASF